MREYRRNHELAGGSHPKLERRGKVRIGAGAGSLTPDQCMRAGCVPVSGDVDVGLLPVLLRYPPGRADTDESPALRPHLERVQLPICMHINPQYRPVLRGRHHHHKNWPDQGDLSVRHDAGDWAGDHYLGELLGGWRVVWVYSAGEGHDRNVRVQLVWREFSTHSQIHTVQVRVLVCWPREYAAMDNTIPHITFLSDNLRQHQESVLGVFGRVVCYSVLRNSYDIAGLD